MLKSMTGFGKGEFADEKRNILVEMKSVNHRYCDINVKIAKRYMFVEEKIKSILKKYINRGKVEVFVVVEPLVDADVNIKINSMIAKQYMENLQQLSKELNLNEDITIEYISGLPDVMKAVPDVENERDVIEAVEIALFNAIRDFNEMREIEGTKLAEDIIERGAIIKKHISSIESKTSILQKKYASKLVERINDLLEGNADIPEERIITEAAIFADKANITEELVRLDSHIIQLNDIIGNEKASGKKLDFLAQEMNREANTIGSKANDLGITRVMLEIKSEIEKIREQVQNIE